jgi:hypothetical protein
MYNQLVELVSVFTPVKVMSGQEHDINFIGPVNVQLTCQTPVLVPDLARQPT